MSFSFWEIFRGRAAPKEVSVADLFGEARTEYRLRELALQTCIDLIAGAVGRADFRTFQKDTEVFGETYFRWNIEPNRNQNSTVFLHQLIDNLCRHNEALIVSVKRRGADRLDMYVADAWKLDSESALRENRYKDVKSGATDFYKSFPESDVLHLTLNRTDVKDILDKAIAAHDRMIGYAQTAFEQATGNHWKVHADRARRNEQGQEENITTLLNKQFSDFLNTPSSVILEFDGMTYTDVSRRGGKEELDAVRTLFEDVFNETARAFKIPIVLVQGKVEGTKDATERFLSECIDPICDQLQEEAQRKEWTFEEWQAGSFIRVDTSAIRHFDLFENAASVEKLIGSGAYSINELRRAANQPRINAPWADAHYMTLNIEPVESQTRPLGAGKEET